MKKVLVFILFVLFGTQAFAQDFNDAFTVYKSGEKSIAIKMYKRLAEQGDLRAQSALSSMYLFGDGVNKDTAIAYKYAKLAAVNQTLGSIHYKADAQYHVAWSYAYGHGVTIDFKLAYMWATIAYANDAWNAESMLSFLDLRLNQQEKNKSIKMANKCISSNFKKCGY